MQGSTQRLSAQPLSLLVALALSAFAANSLLARAALSPGDLDAASFTAIRILSGAVTLAAILSLRGEAQAPWRRRVDWRAAAMLFLYAALFSFAYLQLDAGLGALLLFASVQATMIGIGFWRGERVTPMGGLGALLALGGAVYLLAPGAAAPQPLSAVLMIGSGVAWGVYSLLGRGAADPTAATAGNFLGAAAFCLPLVAFAALSGLRADPMGALLATLSGALASGCGYVIWYAALPRLSATRAAILQLGTPVIAAIAGVLLLSEPLTWRLCLGALAILGGVGLYLTQKERPVTPATRRRT